MFLDYYLKKTSLKCRSTRKPQTDLLPPTNNFILKILSILPPLTKSKNTRRHMNRITQNNKWKWPRYKYLSNAFLAMVHLSQMPFHPIGALWIQRTFLSQHQTSNRKHFLNWNFLKRCEISWKRNFDSAKLEEICKQLKFKWGKSDATRCASRVKSRQDTNIKRR